MSDEKSAGAVAPVTDPDEEEVAQSGVQLEQWEWYDDPPTRDIVKERLGTITRWDVRFDQYAEYVQPLGQNKKLSAKGDPDVYKMAWVLYFTVGGRVAMINAAQEEHDWCVEFVPEPETPTGIPGYLRSDDDRLVYREICRIHDGSGRLLGSRPGTAWVPTYGGSQAKGSNPYEKVETSARGRAIAAWGFGVLPGSGIASLEEMLSIAQNAAAGDDQGRRGRRSQRSEQRPRADVESELLATLIEIGTITGADEGAMMNRVATFAKKNLQVQLEMNEAGGLDLTPLKDGQLAVLLNRLRQELSKVKAEAPME